MIYNVRFFVCSDFLPDKDLSKYNGKYSEFTEISNICVNEQCCADIRRFDGTFVGSVIESGLFTPSSAVLDP